MELSKRKNLRLKDYDYSKNGAYFVTICVREKHEMLGKIVGGDAHIAPISQLSEYGLVVQKHIENINTSYPYVSVNKYVIMPNHIHLIFVINGTIDFVYGGTMWASSPTSAVIPTIVRTLKTMVTKECGFSFWQRSYHDHIIQNEDEYRKIWQYIDENPAKWEEDRYFIHN